MIFLGPGLRPFLHVYMISFYIGSTFRKALAGLLWQLQAYIVLGYLVYS